MTKAELVALMAKSAGGSKASAERAMNAFVTGVIESLRRGKTVTISGFGTFVVARRASRAGRDPRTGKTITIPAAKVPRFRPSRSLKSAVR
jgi:DNA-binding protein HU-beta